MSDQFETKLTKLTNLNDVEQITCICGQDKLYVFYSGMWETSFKCPKCGLISVIHSG